MLSQEAKSARHWSKYTDDSSRHVDKDQCTQMGCKACCLMIQELLHRWIKDAHFNEKINERRWVTTHVDVFQMATKLRHSSGFQVWKFLVQDDVRIKGMNFDNDNTPYWFIKAPYWSITHLNGSLKHFNEIWAQQEGSLLINKVR